MKTLLALVAIVGAAVGYAACFHDDGFKNGTVACSTDTKRLCPSGSFCIDNFCIHPDLLGVDTLGVDGAAFIAVDGGIDAADDF